MSAQTKVIDLSRFAAPFAAVFAIVALVAVMFAGNAIAKGKPMPSPVSCSTGSALESGTVDNKGFYPEVDNPDVEAEVVNKGVFFTFGGDTYGTSVVFGDGTTVSFKDEIVGSTSFTKKLTGKATAYVACGGIVDPAPTTTTTTEPTETTTTTAEPTETMTTTAEPTETTTTVPGPLVYNCIFEDPNFEGRDLEFRFDHTIDGTAYPPETQFVIQSQFWHFEAEVLEGQTVHATVTTKYDPIGVVTVLDVTIIPGEFDEQYRCSLITS